MNTTATVTATARINVNTGAVFQDLEQLMGSIQYACKTIANLVSRAGISDLTGLQVTTHKSVC